MENHNQLQDLKDLQHLVRASLNQQPTSMSVEVTTAGKDVLHGRRVHLDADAFAFAVRHRDGVDLADPLTIVERVRLLDLLCAAREHMCEDHCGHFEHWIIGRHSTAGVPVLYRFAVYESSLHGGDWLITQSSV